MSIKRLLFFPAAPFTLSILILIKSGHFGPSYLTTFAFFILLTVQTGCCIGCIKMLTPLVKSIHRAFGVALPCLHLSQGLPKSAGAIPRVKSFNAGATQSLAQNMLIRPFSAVFLQAKNPPVLSDVSRVSLTGLCHKHTKAERRGSTPISKRFVLTAKNSYGRKIDSTHVVQRFLRLGNGMWLRRIPGHNNQLWKKIMKKGGPQKVYRMRRHIICSSEETRILDKMVTPEFKKQRWTVSDPYAGYDSHVKFHYNPWDIPGTNAGKDLERGEYMWRRYSDSLVMRKQNRTKHARKLSSNRQKPIPRNPYFH